MIRALEREELCIRIGNATGKQGSLLAMSKAMTEDKKSLEREEPSNIMGLEKYHRLKIPR